MNRRRCLKVLGYGLFVTAMAVFCVCFSDRGEKEDDSLRIASFQVLQQGEEISAVCFDKERVWVGGNDGIRLYDPVTRKVVQTVDGVEMIYSAGMLQTPDGSMWIGHEDGLTRIDEFGSRSEYRAPDIPKGRVNTVEWDQEAVWIGTYSGAAKLEPGENGWEVTEIRNRAAGLVSDSVNVIRSVGDTLWFASYLDTKNGGITIVSDRGSQTITVEDGLVHPYVTSLLPLADGRMLAGCGYMNTGGLAVIAGEDGVYQVTETYGKEDGLPGEKIRFLYQDAFGYLWITTEYDGIVIFNPKTSKSLYFTEEHGLSDNEIKCMTETEEAYWLGGKYGLTVIPKEEIQMRMGL